MKKGLLIAFLLSGCAALLTPVEDRLVGIWEMQRHFVEGKYKFPEATLELDACTAGCLGRMIYEGDTVALSWALNDNDRNLRLIDSTGTWDANWRLKALSNRRLRMEREVGGEVEEFQFEK